MPRNIDINFSSHTTREKRNKYFKLGFVRSILLVVFEISQYLKTIRFAQVVASLGKKYVIIGCFGWRRRDVVISEFVSLSIDSDSDSHLPPIPTPPVLFQFIK